MVNLEVCFDGSKIATATKYLATHRATMLARNWRSLASVSGEQGFSSTASKN